MVESTKDNGHLVDEMDMVGILNQTELYMKGITLKMNIMDREIWSTLMKRLTSAYSKMARNMDLDNIRKTMAQVNKESGKTIN